MATAQNFMQRAIELAYKGSGYTRTNPMVGAVIVHQNRIIGEGYHTGFGKQHAEIEAFKSVSEKDKPLLSKSSMYVTLEPCSHYGKTPPCSLEIIRQGIKKVYIGVTDPFPQVNGRGVEMLQEAGIEVETAIEKADCEQLIQRFRTSIEHDRPFIHLKWAQSADGYLGRSGEQTPISSPETKIWVHKMRAQNDAILVGSNTLGTDDPRLDNRLFPGPSPIKLIIDRKGSITDKDHRFFRSTGDVIGILSADSPYGKLYDDAIYLDAGLSNIQQLQYILQACYKRNIGSIFVEGGKILLEEFIWAGLWDQADVIRSSHLMLEQGIPAPHIEGNLIRKFHSAEDEILTIAPKR